MQEVAASSRRYKYGEEAKIGFLIGLNPCTSPCLPLITLPLFAPQSSSTFLLESNPIHVTENEAFELGLCYLDLYGGTAPPFCIFYYRGCYKYASRGQGSELGIRIANWVWWLPNSPPHPLLVEHPLLVIYIKLRRFAFVGYVGNRACATNSFASYSSLTTPRLKLC